MNKISETNAIAAADLFLVIAYLSVCSMSYTGCGLTSSSGTFSIAVKKSYILMYAHFIRTSLESTFKRILRFLSRDYAKAFGIK
jgi:hypothetical protein